MLASGKAILIAAPFYFRLFNLIHKVLHFFMVLQRGVIVLGNLYEFLKKTERTFSIV